MNIRPLGERHHKLRFADSSKARRIKYETDKRLERQGKRQIKLHSHYTDSKIPDAEDLKQWVREYHKEHGTVPNTLLMSSSVLTKSVSVFVPEVVQPGEWPVISLKIAQSEFSGLEYRNP